MALIINAKGTMSGKEGGIVYSHNRYGSYTRQRIIPTNPASSFQNAVRAAFEALANYWTNTLTPAERAAWDTYAANVTMTNRLSLAINITGMSMFVRNNTPRLLLGLSVKAAAPTTFTLGAIHQPAVGAIVVGPPSTVSITPNVTDDWYLNAAGRGYVLFSRPQDPSINFCKGPFRRSVTPLVGLGGAVVMSLPFNVVAGQKIFAQMRGIGDDSKLSAAVSFQFSV